MDSKAWAIGGRQGKSGITADEPDRMPQDGIAWTGGFRQWRKEEEVGSRPKRGKYKRTPGQESQQASSPMVMKPLMQT